MSTISKITIDDRQYPKNLKNIYNPPKALYVNGSVLPQDDVAVALVGSRRASAYGLEACERLAFELGLRGITVVSGMAIGIDTAAHRGALKAKARTIAVMGSGHGRVYPPQNKDLYREIAMRGAVITEFEDDVEPLSYNFPKRNRIISGLALGVIVVEAARNSGALITANFAAEQGRTVFAVPGKISSGTSAGTNELIKDGARLVQSVDDVIEELSLTQLDPVSEEKKGVIDKKIRGQIKSYVYNSLADDERAMYKALSDEPTYIDDLIRSSGFSPSKAAEVLLRLELKKLVKEIPGKCYVRVEN